MPEQCSGEALWKGNAVHHGLGQHQQIRGPNKLDEVRCKDHQRMRDPLGQEKGGCHTPAVWSGAGPWQRRQRWRQCRRSTSNTRQRDALPHCALRPPPEAEADADPPPKE